MLDGYLLVLDGPEAAQKYLGLKVLVQGLSKEMALLMAASTIGL